MPTPRQLPEYAANSQAFRACLRREKLAQREALTPVEHRRRSAAIEAVLADELASVHTASLSIYVPIRNEFDPLPLAARLAATGWRISMPVVVAKGQAMVFRPWQPGIAMAAGTYGIPVPVTDAVAPIPDLVLLPVVAFDLAGYRLGYGGGYFDRTLATLVPAPRTIGVGYDLAEVQTILPQPHDLRLASVITESGCRRFRSE